MAGVGGNGDAHASGALDRKPYLMSKMRDEIHEQPAVLERTLQAERGPIEELRKVLERDPPRLIMLAARGTSDNAAQFEIGRAHV